MIEENYSLGIAGVPGTFPTQRVQMEIFRITANKLFSRSKVNDMYFVYKEAVMEKGLAPYPGKAGEVTPYIVEKTGYTNNDVRFFLVALMNMAKAGTLDQKFLNPKLQEKTFVGKVEKAFSEGGLVPKTLTAAKWVSILALAGFGLYLVRPLLAKRRK